jgi:putative nucleotidyltransferase with HDIG domain
MYQAMKFNSQEEEKLANVMFEILGGMQSPSFVCNQDGIILFANKKYKYRADKMLENTPFWNIYPLTDRIPDYFKNAVEQVMETRSEITFKECSFIVRVLPIDNILVKELIYIVYFEDITSQIILNNQIKIKQKLLEQSFLDTILTISEIVESRDAYTAGHQKRVAALAVNIAVKAGISDLSILNCIYFGALLHDIGKISIPVEYLVTPRQLTTHEYEIMKAHVSIGYKIIEHISFPWDIKSVINQHHERLDGSGYPNGLKGDEISEAAKIVAIADAYEAMSTDRPYRKLVPHEMILLHLKENKGKLFDSDYVDCLMECLSGLNNVYETNHYYSGFELFNNQKKEA